MPHLPINISDLRRDYSAAALSEDEIAANPFVQFDQWLQQALQSQLSEPTAMFVATATAYAAPSLRTVLLKEHGEAGFVFYTNYSSRKGRQIAENSQVALLFYWDILERQIRIEGNAQRISPLASDAYFDSRPHTSRLGAVASPQSQIIESRMELEKKISELSQQYPDGCHIERPAHWGGYVVKPQLFEFWQGRPSRLHDRLQYNLQPDGLWHIVRLAP